MFGFSYVPASLVGFDQKAVTRGEPIYQDLREKIRISAIVHVDETSWRNNGRGHYVWFAGNENLAFFHIDRHRSAEVAKAIFGNDFAGTLVRDRYAAYNAIGANWQSCLAHILTTTKEIRREHALLPETEKDEYVDSLSCLLKDLCARACAIGQQLKSGDTSQNSTKRIEKHLLRDLKEICKQPLHFRPAEILRKYLIGPEQKNLFTFLRIPGVPPTNNHAEQALRKTVIFRKVCFGTRIEHNYCRMASPAGGGGDTPLSPSFRGADIVKEGYAKAGVKKCLKLLDSGLRRELSRTIKSGMTDEGWLSHPSSCNNNTSIRLPNFAFRVPK